jgi:hypothetical protein
MCHHPTGPDFGLRFGVLVDEARSPSLPDFVSGPCCTLSMRLRATWEVRWRRMQRTNFEWRLLLGSGTFLGLRHNRALGRQVFVPSDLDEGRVLTEGSNRERGVAPLATLTAPTARGLTPAVRAEQERQAQLDAKWNKAREAARLLLETTGMKAWISTREFLVQVSRQALVDRTTAVLILDELKSNQQADYRLGKGVRHPDATFADTAV